MCHSRLPTPETAFCLCASIRGNGGQVDRREKSNVFSMLHRKNVSSQKARVFVIASEAKQSGEAVASPEYAGEAIPVNKQITSLRS